MLSNVQYSEDFKVVEMSSYMMMPKDYARKLMQLGQREKASAFMEYMFDLDEKKDNSLRFYASSWNVGKTTASRWIEDFKYEIAKHFDFWTIQNELKYRGTVAGQSRDSKRDSKIAINTYLQDSKRDSKKNGFGTVAGQSINTINTNKRDSEKKQVFSVPSIEEIAEYIATEKLNIDANKFYYYYESNGWMVGKNKMKSWKMALKSWNSQNSTNKTVTKREVYGGLI